MRERARELTSDMAALVAATAITRFVFRSHLLYDIDSVNFALALKRFDPGVHQPHPPGYFLYVCLGRLANLIFSDANTTLVALSILFSCGAVAMIYVLAHNWFGRNAALFAGIIFLFSPLAWFHGTVALTYIVETFFSALIGYLCWRVYSGAPGYILPGGIAVGVAAGFRPSSLLLLCPLFLFSIHTAGRKRIAAGTGALVLTLLAWFVPMIYISGGAAYFSSLVSLWLIVPSRATVFNSSPANSFVRAWVIAGIYLLSFGCAAILPVTGLRMTYPRDRQRTLFTCFWIAPGLLFFTFIYLKFVNSGYLLMLSPPVCAWMGLWASNWYANFRLSKIPRILVVAGCAAANTAIFLWAPVYCSYREVRRFEAELTDIVLILPQIASPKETMIVSFDSHFMGYRHAGYYLPEYETVQFPAVRLASGPRVFEMRNRDTRLASEPLVPAVRNFIIFPLPSGDSEYRDYMAQVRTRFPAADLHTIVRNGYEFTVGPAADLRFLFPGPVSPHEGTL